jgi:GR25 family glycosyltransferase involved in LPS biosynthesis
MKTWVVYVSGNEISERCLQKTVKSLQTYHWDYEIIEGVTPDTLNENEFPYPDLKGGRLESFLLNPDPTEQRKYKIKKSCVYNHLRFAQEVIKRNEPMIFLEHDVVVTAPPPSDSGVMEFCFLNIEGAFKKPSVLSTKHKLVTWFEEHNHLLGMNVFGESYPLKYYKETRYKGHNMTPGTSAYMLTPEGAKRLLRFAKDYGLEQSDFIYNEQTIFMQYIYPSPTKFQKINPNLSHKL